MQSKPLARIDVLDLFPEMRAALLALLRDLNEEEWNAPTACAGWTVKDVALHILGDDISILARKRDDFHLVTDLSPWGGSLLTFINEWNDLWVRALRRMSTPLVTDLLAFTGPQLHAFFAALDPDAPYDGISWAGLDSVPAWQQIAREYTEYWMHHQHVSEAVGQSSLKEPRFLAPLIAAFLWALPYTYHAVDVPEGTLVRLAVTGEAGGEWHLVRAADRWELYQHTDLSPACEIAIDADTVWRIATKGIAPEAARQRATITGDAALAEAFFTMVSIIA